MIRNTFDQTKCEEFIIEKRIRQMTGRKGYGVSTYNGKSNYLRNKVSIAQYFQITLTICVVAQTSVSN